MQSTEMTSKVQNQNEFAATMREGDFAEPRAEPNSTSGRLIELVPGPLVGVAALKKRLTTCPAP